MNGGKKNPSVEAFSAEYWRSDGGRKWADNIEQTEASLWSFSLQLLDRAGPEPGTRILDVGCGGGADCRELALRTGPGGEVLGSDISPDILAIARTRHADIPNLRFLEADAASFDFGTARYDLVYSRFGLMFFTDPGMAFVNLRRCLMPGGRMAFLCWRGVEENPWMSAPAAAVFSVIKGADRPAPGNGPGPFSLGDPDHLRGLLEAAGFETVMLEAIDTPMRMGEMTAAVAYVLRMGPAGALLADATETQVCAARAAVHAALDPYDTMDGVMVPAGAWLVTTR